MLYLFIHLKLMNRILVIGSSGQIGTELVMSLRKKYGNDFVVASDIRKSNVNIAKSGPFEILDIDGFDNLSIPTKQTTNPIIAASGIQ